MDLREWVRISGNHRVGPREAETGVEDGHGGESETRTVSPKVRQDKVGSE